MQIFFLKMEINVTKIFFHVKDIIDGFTRIFKRNMFSIDLELLQIFFTNRIFLFLPNYNSQLSISSTKTYNRRFFPISLMQLNEIFSPPPPPQCPSILKNCTPESDTASGLAFESILSVTKAWWRREREIERRERERETVSSSRRSGASTPIESWCVRAGGVECISRGMTWMAEAGEGEVFKIRQRRKAIPLPLSLS